MTNKTQTPYVKQPQKYLHSYFWFILCLNFVHILLQQIKLTYCLMTNHIN